MDSAQNTTLWTAFPKIELHRHLEGTFNIETLFRIAQKNKLDVPCDFSSFKKAFQFPREAPPDFHLFLSKFKNTWYRSLEDVYTIVYESVKAFKRDNLFYVELRFNPEHFALYNNFDRVEVTNLIIDAGNRAAAETGLRIAYIISFNRGQFDQDYFIALYQKLLALGRREIVGVDLAGDESNYPVKRFSRLFQAVAEDARWKSTIHAGEVTPPTEIWDAIALGASRIGHGTSSIQDPALPPFLAEHGIVLEQCITSNHQTGSWPDEKTHPFGSLYRMGAPVTLNSDDPSIQNTELSDDYAKAARYFSFTQEDFITLNMRAIAGSFLPEPEKERLRTEYRRALDSFRAGLSRANSPG